MARFAQYAMAATEEALVDADWKPDASAFAQREMTVCSFLSGCDLCLRGADGVRVFV